MEWYMGIMMLLALLTAQKAQGAYPLDRDLAQMAGAQSAKKWLVFMDTRIWRCLRLVNLQHRPHYDLLYFQRCFVVLPEPTPEKCYRRNQNHLSISNNRFNYKSCVFTRCLYACPRVLHISVHNMFNINLTWIQFTVLDSTNIYPNRGNCHSARMKFKVTFNKCLYVYCGTRYPSSTFVDSNRAKIEMPICGSGEFYVLAEVGVIDNQPLPGRCGPYLNGLAVWGNLKPRTYQITVEMIDTVAISLKASAHQLQKVLIYNGPDPNMPKLLPYKLLYHQACYKSSTFQVLIVFLYHRNSPIEVKYNSLMDKEPHIITMAETLHLRNNTGCGNNYDKSWMCILSISAPRNTYARIKVIRLHITGLYKGTLESAGVAIYNLINNTAVLVAHFSNDINEYATVTGTGSKLLVSVYGYSPFAVLSVIITAESSQCVGRFVKHFVEPCLEKLVERYNNSPAINSYCRGSFYISFNVSHGCITFQNVVSSNEHLGRKTARLLIHFDHDSHVRVDYHSTGRYACTFTRIFGSYHNIYGNSFQYSYSAMGDIHHLHIITSYSTCGHNDFAIATMSETSCMHPCDDVNIAIVSSYGGVPMCDTCKYLWLDGSGNRTWYNSVPNKMVTLERLQGDQTVTVRIKSQTDINAGGHTISHVVSRFKHHFRYKRQIGVELTDGAVWRVRRDVFSKIYLVEGGNQEPIRKFETGILQRREEYEYIIAAAVQESETPYDVWCGLQGATLLTIYDNKELRFVVEKIMQPLGIEHIFIDFKRPVSCVPG